MAFVQAYLAFSHFVLYCIYALYITFFYKLKVYGHPALSKSIGAIFLQNLLTLCLCATFC